MNQVKTRNLVLIGQSSSKASKRILANNDLSNFFSRYFVKTELINIEIMILNSLNIKTSLGMAEQNQLSKVNISNCEDEIKLFNKISTNTSLVFRKTDYAFSFNEATKVLNNKAGVSVLFSLYNSLNGEKLSFRPCSQVLVKMPIQNLIDFKSPPYVDLIKNGTVDIFNSEDKFYNDKCTIYTFKNISIPINTRRTYIFPNNTVSCGTSCSYLGIDENGYINCDCTNPMAGTSNNLIQNFREKFLSKIDLFSNVDILKCNVRFIL